MTLADAMPDATVEHDWEAMGSDAHLHIHAQPGRAASLAAYGEMRIAELEALWTRFRSTSEISALNAAGGRPMRCSPETVRLVESLVNAWWMTDGAFDPTLLGSLVRLGYDVSRRQPSEPIELAPDCYTRGRPDEVLIDRETGLVQLPPGTALDPGGLGKGLAADIVVAEVIDRGAIGALVSVGGDIAVSGTPEDGGGWLIEVQPHPGLDAELVRLAAGGIATSSTQLRTWTAGGSARHHLIDPVTGQPTTGTATGSAVLAGSAAIAEAFTKPAFVCGVDSALATYDRLGLAAKVWCGAGQIDGDDRHCEPSTCSSTWASFAVDPGVAGTPSSAPVPRPNGPTR